MSWLILVIVSAVLASLSRILQRVLLKERNSDPFAFAFVFQLLVSLLFVFYTLVTHTLAFPQMSALILNLIIMAILYGLMNIFLTNAFKLAEASEASIIFASSTLWSVLSAVLLLGERLTVQKMIGVFLILGGLVAVNYTKSKWSLNKGHLFALLAAICFGFAFTNDAFIISHFKSTASYILLSFVLSSFAILLFRPGLTKHISYYVKPAIIPKLLFCGVFYAGAVFAIFEAYKRGGPVSVISPISESSLILTVTISYFFLKEKNNLINKIVGTAFVFGGILLLL
jgi:transporter family protein